MRWLLAGGRSSVAVRLALLAVTLLLVAGCTTRTVGMQAPLAHDYDGLQWRPLDSTVAQELVVAPGYTALVENDPATDSNTLRQRIDALPPDVRDSEMVELRVAVRPSDELIFDADSTLQVRGIDGEEPLFEAELHELSFADGWAVVDDLPPVEAGDQLVIEIRPGSSSSGWEYGYAVGLIPYGGAAAVLDFEGPEPVQLGTAIGFQTIFEQQTDVGEIAGEGLDSVLDGFFGDPVLMAIYGGLAVAGAIAAVFWSAWYRRT